jgi:hypothetical protein
MAYASDPTDPSHLTPDQRLDEVAHILATGMRRLLSLRSSPPQESPPNCLEVSGDMPLHVSCPVNTAGERI